MNKLGFSSRPSLRTRIFLYRIILIGSVSLSPSISWSQSLTPPPRQDSQSPTGVSFANGSLNYQHEDLTIGGGFPNGLSLIRTYNSASVVPNDIFKNVAGWTVSIIGFVSNQKLPIDPDSPPRAGKEPWIYTVSIGGKSVGFLGGSGKGTENTGGPVGNYRPISPTGASLVFNGANTSGYYTFTDSDGSVINFTSYATNRISNWTMPDGTRLDFTYVNGYLKSVFSNRGWALISESENKICAVNLATKYVSTTGPCPANVSYVSYNYLNGTYNTSSFIMTSATIGSRITTYRYDEKDHLSCVISPGQNFCKTQNFFAACPEDPDVVGLQAKLHRKDYVTSQINADGEVIEYKYDNQARYPVSCPQFKNDKEPDYRPFSGVSTEMVINKSLKTVIITNSASLPIKVTDELLRDKNIFYDDNSLYDNEKTLVSYATNPEGDKVSFYYDDRGNIITRTIDPKIGSTNSSLSTSANYPADCQNIKVCNKPVYVIDNKGNRTDYVYDPTHGGILTETGPADVNSIRPVKRYAYGQRYAWILSSNGNFIKASSPVWVMLTQKTCKATATVGDGCSGGAADEVVTSYDYGPDAGPNNLMLRGVVVTADGVSLRTCYGYDQDGNRISETKPKAGLGVCP